MLVERLKLNDYRSYAALELDFADGVNVIAGENGQGKTNAVEAIFLCAFGRSHRTPRDAELIRFGMAGGYVGASISTGSGGRKIEMKLRTGERKRVLIDSKPIARTGELMGVLRVVMFSPEDLQLVKDGPAARRRFMDMELSGLKPAYFYALQQYNAVLKQRNALLRSETGRCSPAMLSIWNEQLCAQGRYIITARAEFCERIGVIAGRTHDEVTRGRERLELRYAPNVPTSGGTDVAQALRAALEDGVQDDMRRGFTTRGPHRDDIALSVDGTDARTFASQGQQRTAALALKLSEIELIRELSNERPVLILDDVMSELDEGRQQILARSIGGCQSFITCASTSSLEAAGMKGYTLYRCENNTLRREN